MIAISVDSEYSHLAWSQAKRSEGGLHPLKIPLVSDISKSITRSYGILHNDSVALRYVLSYFPRGLFIVDPRGVVRHSTINDLGIGRSFDETVRVLQAIQFNDAHGDVCPANWTEGSETVPACSFSFP